jgi:hypothetical protein
MPPWYQGRRIEEIRSDFDVFALGKTLWSMVSGEQRLPFWYFKDPEFDLETKFPEDPDMHHVNALLAKCVVERATACLADARELLREIDAILDAIDLGIGRNGLRTRCLMCGRGEYQVIAGRDHASITNFGLEPRGAGEFRVHACRKCGHVQLFHRSGDFKPDSWPDQG